MRKIVDGEEVACTPEEEAAILAEWAAAASAVNVPQEVTMRQARLALLGAGLLATVESKIDGMAEPAKSAARIEWDHSQTVQRSKGLVLQLGQEMGLTSEQIDNLFIAAAAL
jgi:hypothetical protein